MKFEEVSPVTDEQRRLAQARQVTIPSLDPSLQPDAPTNDYIAAQHLREPALGNAPNDIEQEADSIMPTPSLVSPTASKKAPSLRLVRAGAVGTVAFLAVVLAAIILYTLG